MITIKLTVTIHSRYYSDQGHKHIQKVTDTFLAQCLPKFLQSKHWTRSEFYYHPDEEAEARGIDCIGMTLKLQAACQTAQLAVLIAQLIQTVVLIFDDLYDGCRFSFQIDSLSS